MSYVFKNLVNEMKSMSLSEFENFHNLSKRNVKLILKILGDFEPLRGSSNVVFNSFVCKLGLF
jgi:hypothetical protein